MAIYDLYGSIADDINNAKDHLEASLGIKLAARDSAYHGAYFQWGDASGEHFLLKRNIDTFDGGPAEDDFSDHRIIFYVNDSYRAENLQAAIEQAGGFVLLRHEDLD